MIIALLLWSKETKFAVRKINWNGWQKLNAIQTNSSTRQHWLGKQNLHFLILHEVD